MLKIRLQRTGRKHETTFRVVLTDSKNSTKSGKYKEMLGSYDPRKDKSAQIDGDRVKYWLSVGAEATGTVHNLLISEKIIEGKKRNVLPKKTVPKKEEKTEEPKAEPQAKESQAEEPKEAPEPASSSPEPSPSSGDQA